MYNRPVGAIRQEKGISENGDKKPGGYVPHSRGKGVTTNLQREVVSMEIAYIVSMALVAIVAIIANRNTKK